MTNIALVLSLSVSALSSLLLGGHARPEPAQSPTPTVTLTGEVGAPNSAYEYPVDPGLFEATIAAHVNVELSMPSNTTIVGWSCQANVCSKRYNAAELAEECIADKLVIENSQTNSVGTGWIVVANSETPDVDICVLINLPPGAGH